MLRTGFTSDSISVSHGGMMPVLQGVILNYEARGSEEAGELAGLSGEGRAGLCVLQRRQIPCLRSMTPSDQENLME